MTQQNKNAVPHKAAVPAQAAPGDQSLPLAWRKALAVLAGVALAVFILRQVGPILTSIVQVTGPFLLALIVAYVFHPIVLFVQRRLRLGRVTGILVVAGMILFVVFAVLAWLIPNVYRQLSLAIGDGIPWLMARLGELAGKYLDEPMRSTVQDSLKGDLGTINNLLRQWLGKADVSGTAVASGGLTAVLGLAGGAATVGGMLGSLSIVALIVFYLLADFHRIPSVIRRMLPESRRERVWEIMLKADKAVGGFLRGQLIVCLINGSLMAVLLMMVGMREYAILVGFVAGILNFVPYLGPISGFVPGALWIAFSTQPMYQNWGDRGIWLGVLVAGFMAIQAFEGFVLQPCIVGKRASLHPLMVIAAFVIGSQAGFGGMIVAVPVAAVVKVLWVELYWKQRTED